MKRIESFLSARLFLVPQIVGDRIYFISNLNGRNSLYVMDRGGSVPEPLLPPDIALQNPHLMPGRSFIVFPKLEKIVVMLDQDGDENYLPMAISLDGGYPEPLFAEAFANHRISADDADLERNTLTFVAESRTQPLMRSYLANLETGELTLLNESLILSVAGLPPGDMFVTGDYGDSIDKSFLQYWDQNGNLIIASDISKGEYRNMVWNKKGDRLATASDVLRIWDQKGSLKYTGTSPDYLWGVSWSPRSKSIVTSSFQQKIRIWDNKARNILSI